MPNRSAFLSMSRFRSKLLPSWLWVPAALAVLYYGNVFLALLANRSGEQRTGSLLFLSVTNMLVRGTQNLFLLSGWHFIARSAANRIPQIEDPVTVLIPSVGVAASLYILPLLSPQLQPHFPMPAALVFLLTILFQLILLRVEDGLDRCAALLLWVFSFQSLELFSNLSEGNEILSNQDTAILSMAGTALFFSFLSGAVSSTWLISRYSIRMGLLRQTWAAPDLRNASEDAGLKTVTMVDVNNLAHDLKNPIAAIKGTTTMLHKEAPSEKSALILKAAEYMENMVRELLIEDERNAISLPDFCGTIERHIHPFPWGKDVLIRLDPSAEALSISANKIRLLRAVLNVLDNAWRANETAGSRGIELHLRRNAGYVEIEVLDNGPGYRAGRRQNHKSGWGSTGLGLAFTRRVVTLHGGSLLIADRTDRQHGARVLISLPIPSVPLDCF